MKKQSSTNTFRKQVSNRLSKRAQEEHNKSVSIKMLKKIKERLNNEIKKEIRERWEHKEKARRQTEGN